MPPLEPDASKRRPVAALLWLLALGVLLFLPFFIGIDAVPRHVDESYWIDSTRYYRVMVEGEPAASKNRQRWLERSALDQPSVAKYILGFVTSRVLDEADMDELRETKRRKLRHQLKRGTESPDSAQERLLRVGRRTMATFGFATCLLVYAIGARVFGRADGAAAALLLAYNPLMLQASKRVMADPPLVFFQTLNLLLIVAFYRALRSRSWSTLPIAVAIGLSIALATGTKLNGGSTAIVFALFVVLEAAVVLLRSRNPPTTPSEGQTRHHPPGDPRPATSQRLILLAASTVLAVATAAATFVALNPHVRDQPIEKSLQMLRYRQGKFSVQRGARDIETPSFATRTAKVVGETLLTGDGATLGGRTGIPLDMFLFLTGLLLATRHQTRQWRHHHCLSEPSIALLWTTVSFTVLLTLLPLDWPRYYLPVVPCAALLSGHALASILHYATQAWSNRTIRS